MSHDYTIENDNLVVRDLGSKDILWIGEFNERKVFKLLPLFNEEDCLVLLDPGASDQPTFENLFRVNGKGCIVWRAPLLHSHDAYTDLMYVEGNIEARTWLGARVIVNPVNGHICEIGFSK